MKSIYYDEKFGEDSNDVVKTPIVNLKLPSGFFVKDAWVYSNLIVARLTNNTLAFYEKPLVAGNL